MSFLTKTHCMPSGAGGNADLVQCSDFSGLLPNTSTAARINPMAANKQIPQNVKTFTSINSVSPIENSVDFALPPDQAETVAVVTTPAVPVQVVGLLLPYCFAFINQASAPAGWWVRSCAPAEVLDFHVRNAYRA